MQITHLKFNTTTFKAINLPPEEKQQSDDLLKNLEKYILDNADEHYEFELPQNDLNDEFMSYAHEYVKNLLGYSNIKFKIKE